MSGWKSRWSWLRLVKIATAQRMPSARRSSSACEEISIAQAIERAQEGDVVVIAGKGHEQGQELADRTIPFDDREVARETLRRLGAAA